jgi:hypothetical protein
MSEARPMSDSHLLLNLSWRLWLVGVFLGPDTYGLSLGPLMVGWRR